MLMAAIFDLRHTQTSDYIRTCLVVLLDPENMSIVVGISLLLLYLYMCWDIRNFLSSSG